MISARVIPGRRLLAGFLAGASGVVALLLFFMLLLLISGFWPMIIDIASGLRGNIPFWPTVGQAFVESLGNLPAFLWSGRWGIVGLGLLGFGLALVDALAARVGRPWRHLISLVALVGLVGTIVFALQYANRETLLSWLAEQPQLMSLQDNALISDGGSLIIGALITLPAAYIIWSLWQWWDVRWRRWLGVRRQQPTLAEEPAAAGGDWLVEQERLHRIKRGAPDVRAQAAAAPVVQPAPESRPLRVLAVLLAAATIALIASIWLYNQSGSQVGSKDLFISTQSPDATAALQFQREPRQVIVVGISGEGQTDVALGSAQQPQQPLQTAALQLIGARRGAQSAAFDMRGMQAGNYWLRVNLRAGDHGQVRYTTLQGGGVWAQVAAWAIGLAAGAWLVLGALIVCELLAARGWMRAGGNEY
jgi:hypothetical protein